MNQKALSLGLRLLLCGMLGSACAQRETPAADKSLLEALPEIVAKVNGEAITRQQVIERFQQAQNMMGHQQHTVQAPDAEQALQVENRPDASDATAATHQAHQMAQDQPSSSANRGVEATGAAPPLDPLEERTLLRHIINSTALERLKLQEAQRLGLSLSIPAIEEQVRLMEQHSEQQMGGREGFEKELRRGHTTLTEWRKELRQQLLIQQLEANRRKILPVGDEEINQYWEKNRKKLSSLWHTDKLDQARDRVRELIQQARWVRAKAEWEQGLVKGARVWVDRRVHTLLAVPSDHTH
jgi:hypothetical protein